MPIMNGNEGPLTSAWHHTRLHHRGVSGHDRTSVVELESQRRRDGIPRRPHLELVVYRRVLFRLLSADQGEVPTRLIKLKYAYHHSPESRPVFRADLFDG